VTLVREERTAGSGNREPLPARVGSHELLAATPAQWLCCGPSDPVGIPPPLPPRSVLISSVPHYKKCSIAFAPPGVAVHAVGTMSDIKADRHCTVPCLVHSDCGHSHVSQYKSTTNQGFPVKECSSQGKMHLREHFFTPNWAPHLKNLARNKANMWKRPEPCPASGTALRYPFYLCYRDLTIERPCVEGVLDVCVFEL